MQPTLSAVVLIFCFGFGSLRFRLHPAAAVNTLRVFGRARICVFTTSTRSAAAMRFFLVFTAGEVEGAEPAAAPLAVRRVICLSASRRRIWPRLELGDSLQIAKWLQLKARRPSFSFFFVPTFKG